MLTLNRRCQAYAKSLIEAGQVDTGESFELTPDDLVELAVEPGRYYLGLDAGQPEDDPVRWRHPVGRFKGTDFVVYLAALEAIADLEADADDVRQAAQTLLGLIDAGENSGDQNANGSETDADDEAGAAAEEEDGGKPPDEPVPAGTTGLGGRADRLAGDELERALKAREERALVQVKADMRERREIVGAAAVREVFGTNHFSRTYSVRASSIDRDQRTARLSFSSEEPYERWFGIEILGHDKGEVRLERLNAGGQLLVDHDTRDLVGVILEAVIDKDRVGRSLVEFGRSARAEEIFVDIEGGIRRNTSVAYIVHTMKLIEEHDDALDIYRVTDWEPLENSIVAIPADPTVGVDRELELAGRAIATTDKENENMRKKIMEFMDKPDGPGGEAAAPVAAPAAAPAAAAVAVDVAAERNEAIVEERKRANTIRALGKEHNLGDLAEEHIAKETSVESFHEILLKAIADGAGGPGRPGGKDDEIGLTAKEARRFSIIRALRAVFAREGFEKFGRSDIDAAGFELECSRDVGKLLGQDAKGILIPMEVLRTPLQDPQARAAEQIMTGRRDLNVASDTAGGYLVDTTYMGMIPLLRNLSLLLSLGATALGGLVGDVAIPRHVSGSTTYWLNEDGEPTESDPVFAQLGLMPHTVGATTDVTRKLLKQASIDMEAFVRLCILQDIATEFDRVGINGSGHSGEPVGILNTTGIGGVADSGGNGSAPDWADVVDVFKELALDNIRIGGLGWLTTVQNACKLMTTKKDGTNLPFIMEDFDENGWTKLMGLKCGVTNNVPSNLAVGSGTNLSALIMAYFPDLVFAQWGTIDLTADRSAKVLSGGLRVVGLADVDTGCRRPQSFSAKKDCITT